jgi:hypothetical protein
MCRRLEVKAIASESDDWLDMLTGLPVSSHPLVPGGFLFARAAVLA